METETIIQDPIEDRLDQMADLLEFRKRYRQAGQDTHAIREAIITLTDEIRLCRIADAGGGRCHTAMLRFSRQVPVETGWYWLRGKLECDVIVHVYHGPDGLSFCDGLEMWTEADPQMKCYEFAGPIPAGV